MKHPTHRWISVALLALLAGCSLVPAASPSPAATLTQAPTPEQPPASPTPTSAPATSSPPPPTGTSGSPTPTAGAIASCPPPSETPAVPPSASLAAPEATAVGGRLGSYDFCNVSADALPPAPASLTAIRLESRMSELTLSLAYGSSFTGWRGTYTNLADGNDAPAGAADFAVPATSARFRGPTAGEWLLRATVEFGEQVGAADYYWRIEVP